MCHVVRWKSDGPDNASRVDTRLAEGILWSWFAEARQRGKMSNRPFVKTIQCVCNHSLGLHLLHLTSKRAEPRLQDGKSAQVVVFAVGSK